MDDFKMVDTSPELPEGFRIRRLQLNDRDRLAFYLMPNDPQRILAFVPTKIMLILCRIGHGIVYAIIPSTALFLVILVIVVTSLSINWFWIGLAWLMLLSSCIGFALTRHEDWHQFCWVVEQQKRLVAYGVLHPYGSYSVLELLQVHPRWMRRGIGSTLLKTMLDHSPKPVYVDSAVHAVKFYTHLGFHKVRFKELSPAAQKHFRLRGVATLLVYEVAQND